MPVSNSGLDQFEVDVKSENGSFVASVPKLGLEARGATPQAALDELQEKQRALVAALTPALGSAAPLSAAAGQSRLMGSGDIRPFAMKAGIVLVAVVVGVYFVTQQLQRLAEVAAYNVQTSLRQATAGGVEFWSPIEINLARLADPSNDVAPEKRARQLREIRTVVDRWRPFVTEILAILIPEDKLGKVPGSPDGSSTPGGG
jgi:hypothetical protein